MKIALDSFFLTYDLKRVIIYAMSKKRFVFISAVLAITLGPCWVQAQEQRRVEQENRESLRTTEQRVIYEKSKRYVPAAPMDTDYFQELLTKKTATNSDVCKVLTVLLGVEDVYSDISSQLGLLLKAGIISGVEAAQFDPEQPLSKGSAAVMFYRALGMKGGMWLTVFGETERYAIRELIHEGIMTQGSVDEIVSGKELILILTEAANYAATYGHSMTKTSTVERPMEYEKVEPGASPETAEGNDILFFDYGGRASFRYDDYKNYDNDTPAVDSVDYISTLDLRLWVKAVLRPPTDSDYQNEHSVYLRFKDEYAYQQALGVAEGREHDGPHLDYGYIILDFMPLGIEAGRRYFDVGQGISYGNVGDGVEITLAFPGHALSTFVSRNLENEENIDMSVPGYAEGSERYFMGSEYAFNGIEGHSFYGYFVIQRDESTEKPDDLFQDFKYDSEHIGVGAQGKLLPSLRYWAEIIKESGQSRVFGTIDKKNIDAWGGILGASYELDLYSHPVLSLQYAYGSGDPGRVVVTDTEFGNSFGKDKNFLYFGYLETGYAVSPLLSNLHMYNAGIYCKPLEAWKVFRHLALNANYYQFYKDRSSGGIYDLEADARSRSVGGEVDIELFWQVLSDLGLRAQYGYFVTGDAYPPATDDNESYFSLSSVITF
ncbi:MAG: alginate export family protein [Candidatus Omnitrophica bacterium]|nr:alginate export family protein [Candidatus Omnitrophota bacterium]